MKVKSTLTFVSALGLLLVFTGCQVALKNRTPERIPANPSGIYTFVVEVDDKEPYMLEGTLSMKVVVNGEEFDMEQSDLGKNFYEYDYKAPQSVNELRYYFVFEYDYKQAATVKHAVHYSTDFTEGNQPHQSRLVNRYVIQLESARGPVGAEIAVVGRGFSEFDTIVMNGQEVDTNFISPYSLTFTVPSLPGGESYPVALRTGQGDIDAGEFLIDQAQFSVLPSEVDINSGDRELMIFRLNNPAPPSGIDVRITTNIPQSVIMPEVYISGGERQVSVPLEGGSPGNGYLYVNAPGYSTVRVPMRFR